MIATTADRLDGRYSFSLTTFDPQGKLAQVERATQAASLGTPVLGICTPKGGVYLCAPQVLPSPLMLDDGTARFWSISPSIAVAHSGMVDGRIVVAAAQRMAIEYEYTYDEEMPVEAFLEELSLLFQEYTIKAGCRPFGCSLLVAYLDEESAKHCLFRIDPSGAVEACGSSGLIGSVKIDILTKLKQLSESGDADEQDLLALMKEILYEASRKAGTTMSQPSVTFVTAKLNKDGLSMARHKDENEKN